MSQNGIEAAAAASDGKQPIEAKAETQGDPADGDANLGDSGKKALKAERDARAAAERREADLKARLDKLEAANLSELERAQRAAQEAQEAAAKATVEALRYRIAAEHSISASDAELFLTASDEASMRTQAQKLAEYAKAAGTSTAPKPDLTQGAQSAPALNSDELTQALARAVGAG